MIKEAKNNTLRRIKQDINIFKGKEFVHISGICILLLVAVLIPKNTFASHFMGGDMTYQCLGNNQYRIQLTVYRDCNSVTSYEPSLPLEANGLSCSFESSVSINLVDNYPITITPLCDLEVDLCDSNEGTYGVQEFLYQTILTLPEDCSQINVSFTDCCRNAAISTVVDSNQENFYIGAIVNTLDADCNSSPQFNNNPTPFSCVGQEVNYNHGVTDADGDELVFSLVDCYRGYNSGVTYEQPYSGTNPLEATDISIDPQTGAISFVPIVLQVGIICVKVEEYRNGIKIGEIVRDIQFTVLNCGTNAIDENILPVLSGINGTASSQGITGEFDVDLCFGALVCFTMDAFDLDGHKLELSWNESIDGATFTVNGNNTTAATAEFCWTPDIENLGLNFFTVTVKDDACDIRGINTYTFTVRVTDGNLDYSYVQNAVSCFGENGSSATITLNDPLVNPTLIWPTNPVQYGLTADNLSAGTYYVIVQDANIECDNASVKVDITEAAAIGIISDGITKNVSCTGGNDGILDIHISGGAEPYSMIWSNGESDTLLTDLVAGFYTVTVTDGAGCEENQTFEITEPPILSLDYTRSDYNGYGLSCTGDNNGWINLSIEGGTPAYSFAWTNSAVSEDLNDLLAGNYTVTVTDVNGCKDSLTISLTEPTPLVSVLDNIAATCYYTNDGSLVIEDILGAVPPYAWSLNGQSFNAVDTFPIIVPNQSRGEKTIYFQDDVGCIYTNTATIASPDSLYVNIIPADTLLELGEDVQISFVTNSTDLVDFNWTSTSATFDCDTCPLFNFLPLETTGFYINLIEETNGCEASGEAIVRLTESSYVFVPNIFTPNEDGFNDKLNVFAQSAAVASINYLRIYNRWGALVYQEEDFQPNDIEIGWDGYENGKEAPTGVYIYALETIYINGRRKITTGDITLLR